MSSNMLLCKWGYRWQLFMSLIRLIVQLMNERGLKWMTPFCLANNLEDNVFDFRLLVKMLRLSLKFWKYSLFVAHSSLHSFQNILCLQHGHVPSGLEKETIRPTLAFLFSYWNLGDKKLFTLSQWNSRKRRIIGLEGLGEGSFLVSPPSSTKGVWSVYISLLHTPPPPPESAFWHKRINTLAARVKVDNYQSWWI